jgi:hypothetical protein
MFSFFMKPHFAGGKLIGFGRRDEAGREGRLQESRLGGVKLSTAQPNVFAFTILSCTGFSAAVATSRPPLKGRPHGGEIRLISSAGFL